MKNEVDMNRTTNRTSILVGLLALASLLACQHAPTTSDEPAAATEAALPDDGTTLSLRLASLTDQGAAVDLLFVLPADQPAPRVAEIVIAYDTDALAWEGAEGLSAVQAADKQVVVQDQGDKLRVVLYAADNTTRLDSGALARLHFTRRAAEAATLSFTDHQPLFAPPEANVGVVLGPPLVIEGG
jgi:hypothetical protein